MTEEHGMYVGPVEEWKGKTALLHTSDDGKGWEAQFDELDHPEAHGWHSHAFTDFSVQLKREEEKT